MTTSLTKLITHITFVVLALMVPYSMALAEKTPEVSYALKILGWVEFVRLEPWGLKTHARMDTGANTSSMSARDIKLFKKSGKKWVKFTFDFKTDTGERSIEIERRVTRMVKIKQHNGQPQERPVVSMDFCLADEVRTAEFNLIDRRGLNYPILLGRRALAGFALIDSSRTYMSKAGCGHDRKKKNKSAVPDSGLSE